MPAYRSSAEAEVRQAVVDAIRRHRPNSRIIHEINVCDFGNRVDVMAVGQAEIITFEIKSAKDKLTRLPAQMKAMASVSHHSIAVIHEKFLVEQKTNAYAAHYERDGEYFLRTTPPEINSSQNAWIYPQRQRAMPEAKWDNAACWNFPPVPVAQALPQRALQILWRAEMYELCGALRVAVGRRATMSDMTDALLWHCTGAELTTGICAALRRRNSVEADPPITTKEKA